MRQAAFFSDNNFQDYEFTRLNTYEKKEMSYKNCLETN